MKTKLLLLTILFAAAFSSCQKDYATNWVGTYDGTSGSNTVQRVVITRVNDKTIKLELQTLVLGTYYTYATIASGRLSSATALSVDEDGTVAGYSGTYHFSGSGTREGGTIVITGSATQTGATTLLYYFTGNK